MDGMLITLPLELLAIILSFLPVAELETVKNVAIPSNYLPLINKMLFAIGVSEVIKIPHDAPHYCHITKIYKGGVLHSETEPAYIEKTYRHELHHWYYKGLLHRPNGQPAQTLRYIECLTRRLCIKQKYYENDELHRLDGPAVIFNILTNDDPYNEQYWIRGLRYQTPKMPLKPDWWLGTNTYD